jgi:hypothetical protein
MVSFPDEELSLHSDAHRTFFQHLLQSLKIGVRLLYQLHDDQALSHLEEAPNLSCATTI